MKKTRINEKTKGFTLIELLVVISVIGLLASVILIALNSARVKARNTKRLADMRQIQTALALYYNANGQYPLDSNEAGCNCDYSHVPSGASDFLPTLSAYITTKINDPLEDNGAPNLNYRYISDDGRTYILQFNIEPAGLGTNCPDFAPPANPGGGQLWCTIQVSS
ncbi:MAG: hypothetical protein A3C85_04320 [Candidatus Doudnabacteria bacterium RIFCSPHIGHO2_02_FULL_48_21]|uniref:Type II secretion system protein GspG C-terminal domain-containing protein n=1 Tax=Candidatus Doudnabacteria bacterium RIFCSPLOWO2_02_FULL_48_13 TaxID=1817845 RepID=A0A1F5QA38_9BACT|nr:MAG: hypothetical protein A2668_00720 [Candidatus Doudnabacteria bacterium RIFCSPHIGHO2_01_FULL_48_180]OGE94114.1 MAG: hypothetical protein A3C85_04320 [Candidatus Doudnabacteria bacterium RIFCSPHIGHO2_02_FULL_48_21]OGE98180.1 MAG: hypothetical protein A3A83_03355 [Candidatus Doudnabacteria bacterium RIFCSPLOWO2_01_FULL_48_57]OGE99079.1 MAG: hypothetical protein A3J05_01450 [Candidatus Doudnabacteria bacterium RIFCSPLOWO2_02_FULL_48_13]